MPSWRAEGPPPGRLGRAFRRSATFARQGAAEACILAPSAAAGPAPGALALNRVGAWVWDRLDGSSPGIALVEALVAEFDLSHERAERDYLALLERLLELGAVEPADVQGDQAN